MHKLEAAWKLGDCLRTHHQLPPRPSEQATEMKGIGSCKWRNWRNGDMEDQVNLTFPSFYFFVAGTRSRTNSVGMGFTTSGNLLNWRWSFLVHWKVTLDSTAQWWDIWYCTSVYAGWFLSSICTEQPGRSAPKEVADVAPLSGMHGQGCRVVMWGIQPHITANQIWPTQRRLSSVPNMLPLTSTLDLTHARVQPFAIHYIHIQLSTGVRALTVSLVWLKLFHRPLK